MSSPPTTPMSQASTRFGVDSSVSSDEVKPFRRRAVQRIPQMSISQDILLFLVAFRIVNALSIKTFFQPDEFFQSLEPAWEMVFGSQSGAWITWEWRNHLRSAIHPAIFAVVYWITSGLAGILRLPSGYRDDLLIVAPKLTQAIFGAMGDYYTWKLGECIFGAGSNEAWAALALTVCNPWQWFCSTRTLSNCLETTLTVMALNFWPWQWSLDAREDDQMDEDGLRKSVTKSCEENSNGNLTCESADQADEATKLRRCLFLAALACVLRPTNLLIWMSITTFALIRVVTDGRMVALPWEGMQIWVQASYLTLHPATKKERVKLLRESVLCGSLVLLLSMLVDRLYYQQWTFPPYRFLYFNIAQSLAIFYGSNDWHYYISQGFPLLLTTFLPFTMIGIYQSLFPPEVPPRYSNNSPFTTAIKRQLATVALLVPFILSFISHKEVRFIYPLLPLLHILAAAPFTTFFLPAVSPAINRSSKFTPRRLALGLVLLLNIIIAMLTTTSHQTAPLTVMAYLRNQHAKYYMSQPPSQLMTPAPSIMTVGFLMPCHSTPWRSHLVHPSIKAWALTCEPPINLNASARTTYMDEADRFYVNPAAFLSENLGQLPTSKIFYRSWFDWLVRRKSVRAGFGLEEATESDAWDGREGRKTWPEYLVFFEQLEPVMRDILKESAYRECWRGWNSWGHDDWRRKGDMIVWCFRKQGHRRKRNSLLW